MTYRLLKVLFKLINVRSKLFFWTMIGAAIATVAGIISKNIAASLFVGAGSSMVLMIVTNLEVDKKVRN